MSNFCVLLGDLSTSFSLLLKAKIAFPERYTLSFVAPPDISFFLYCQALVDNLLSKATDNSLLISRFQEFLEMEDVRYYVMSSIRDNVGKVMDKSKGVGNHHLSAVDVYVDAFFLC